MPDPTSATAPDPVSASLAAHPNVLLALHVLAAVLSVLVAAGVIPTSGEAAQVTLIIGTLLAPFGFAAGHATVKRASAGFGALLLMATIALVGVLLVLAGCNLSGSAAAGTQAGESCIKQDVNQLVGSGSDVTRETLIGAAMRILVAGALDWRAELLALAAPLGKCGAEAVSAAVTAAVAALEAQLGATPSNAVAASRVEPVNAPAIARGQAFLAGGAK